MRPYGALPERVCGTTACDPGTGALGAPGYPARAGGTVRGPQDEVRARSSLPVLHRAPQAMRSRCDPARQYGAGCPVRPSKAIWSWVPRLCRERSLNARRNGCHAVRRADSFQMRLPWAGADCTLHSSLISCNIKFPDRAGVRRGLRPWGKGSQGVPSP
jgi:hypothetical protein